MIDGAVDGQLKRLGVFGGTFDPPHHGHFAIAAEVRAALDLDLVLMVVANDPWQKTAVADVRPASDRFSMVEAGISDLVAAGVDGLLASAIEIERGGPSFSADTLSELADRLPGTELFLLVGSDAAAGLDSWHTPEVIRQLCTTVVVDRGGREGGRPPVGWDHQVVEVSALEISSSDLRRRFATDASVGALMPPSVVVEARRRGLYEGAA